MTKQITETFSTIIVNLSSLYWIFVLSEINWEDLKRKFFKNTFYITSFGKHTFKKSDVILIFQKHSTNTKMCGFVAICQIKDNLGENYLDIVIFKDLNMAKYISSISALEVFNTPLKVSQIDTILKADCKDFTTAVAFNAKYTKNKSLFTMLPTQLGYYLLKNLIALSDGTLDLSSKIKPGQKKKIEKSICSSSDTKMTETIETTEEDDKWDEIPAYSSDSTESETDSDSDIKVVIGHIPILMIPCHTFDWNVDEYMTIKSFKKHFLECNKCDKTDNNNCNVYPFAQNCIIHCTDLKEDKAINSYLEYYHEEKICRFELLGKDKKNNHMYVFRILSKHHVYHNTLLVMW